MNNKRIVYSVSYNGYYHSKNIEIIDIELLNNISVGQISKLNNLGGFYFTSAEKIIIDIANVVHRNLDNHDLTRDLLSKIKEFMRNRNIEELLVI